MAPFTTRLLRLVVFHLACDMSTKHIHMSPTPSKGLALQHVKLGDALETCDGITSDFYPGLSHTYYNQVP